MDISPIRLQQIARQLPPQQLGTVIDFAEFLSFKATKENQQIFKKRPRLKQLDLPVIKDVKFIGDPLLRREDIYDEWGEVKMANRFVFVEMKLQPQSWLI